MKRIALILAGLLLVGCASESGSHSDEHGHDEEISTETQPTNVVKLSADAIRIAGIETEVVSRRQVQSQLKVTGTVTATPRGSAVVTPPAAGKIARLHVQVGDTVRAGQPVATLISRDVADAASAVLDSERALLGASSAVKEAKSQVDLANAKLRTAKQTLGRQQGFARTGAFSQPALQAAQKELADAEADLERGKQDQSVHQVQLERAERLYSQELISRTELEQARLEVETDKIRQRNAERRIDLAKATFQREQRIASNNLSNAREIQAAEADVRSAQIEVEQAKIRHRAARDQELGAQKGLQGARALASAQAGGAHARGGTVTITAPIAGVVGKVAVSIGQAVEMPTEICRIDDLSSVWVTANVPEKQLAKVRRGLGATVTVSSHPEVTLSGVVDVVEARLDPKTRTMAAQILVKNAGRILRPEMFTSISIGSGERSEVVAVSKGAVVDGRLVYVAKSGGEFEERPVELGQDSGEFVEIVRGLSPGERVVSRGAFVLKSEKVKAGLKGHEH